MRPVLFDLDGTLIDSLPNIQAAANAVLADWNVAPLALDRIAGFVGLGEGVFVDRMMAAVGLEPDHRAAVMSTFLKAYAREAENTKTFPQVLPVLMALRAQGVPLGVVTNKPRGPLGPTLASAGLTSLFDVVIAGDDLPKRKPDPMPLVEAMARLGETACVYVGDSEVDAATAEAAEVPFVLFTEGICHVPHAELTCAATFDDFSELPVLLSQLI